MDFFRCGEIVKTHGIKGDLKVKNLSDFDRFKKNARLYICHKDDYIEVKVNNVKDFGNYLLVSFQGLLDINLVEQYHGDFIYISEEDRDLSELDENSFYISDLIDCAVYTDGNEYLGKVVEIENLPQCDYLVLNIDRKRKLIPFIDEFIVDVKEDKIIIKKIEGLI